LLGRELVERERRERLEPALLVLVAPPLDALAQLGFRLLNGQPLVLG
jgi:hypothetical protein